MSLVRSVTLRRMLLGLAVVGLAGSGASLARAEDPAPATAEATIPWVRNWSEAQAQAKKESKDLLIDFTGSDWCGWCKRLEGEVFSHAEFLDKATKQFVFVFLDFEPNGEAKRQQGVDPDLNGKLKGSYAVNGFPTIILANAEGLPYARTGYQEGGPEAYLSHLAELREGGTKIKALIAHGKTDAAAFKAGFEALAESGFLGHPDYAWTIEHAEKQDKDGSLGLKPIVDRERAHQRSKVEEEALQKLVAGKRSKEEVPWEELHTLLKGSKDLGGMALLNFAGAVGDWLVSQKRWAEAKVMFQLPLRDKELTENEHVKSALEQRIAQCDEGLAPKAPETPEAPKDAPK